MSIFFNFIAKAFKDTLKAFNHLKTSKKVYEVMFFNT